MHNGLFLELGREGDLLAALARAASGPHRAAILVIREQNVIPLIDANGLIDEYLHARAFFIQPELLRISGRIENRKRKKGRMATLSSVTCDATLSLPRARYGRRSPPCPTRAWPPRPPDRARWHRFPAHWPDGRSPRRPSPCRSPASCPHGPRRVPPGSRCSRR